MSPEQRHDERATTHARAVLPGTQTPGYLRDLSASGCKVVFMDPVPVKEGQTVTVQIIPVDEPTIGPFQILLDVRWMRNDPLWHMMGGKIRGVSEQDTASLKSLVRCYVSAPEGG